MSYTVEVVLANVCETVGESPYWDSTNNSLSFVDIRRRVLHRWNVDSEQHEHVELDEELGFAVPSSDASYMVGQGATIARYNWHTQTTTTLASVDAYRFNDAKCDPSGRLWTGSLGESSEERALYSMERDGQLRRRLADLQFPNGVAWNKAATLMYVVDTAPRVVYSFKFDVDTGDLENQRILLDFNELGSVEEAGKPDGLCVDDNDNLWIACFGAGKVINVDHKSGEIISEVLFTSAKQITSCCFGGNNLDELFVTSAKSRLTEEEQAAQPLAGSLFKVRNLRVEGLDVKGFIPI